MDENIRVIAYGLGAMGSGMVRALSGKANMEIVGAVSGSGRNVGVDLGDAIDLGHKMGVPISANSARVWESLDADVVLHSTCTGIEQTLREAAPIMRSGKNVISIAEEVSFPVKSTESLFAELNKVACDSDVTILGTGINPGFMMDCLPASLSSIMLTVKSIKIRRVVNYGRYGQSVWDHIGVARDVAEFERALESGEVVLHFGLEQTVAGTAKAMGWELDNYTLERIPIISKIARPTTFGTVQPGQVGGFRQLATGWKCGEALVVQELIGLINPDEEEDDVALGNEYWLEGDPSVHFTLDGEFADQGGKGTIARAINAIPAVIAAKPGFVSVLDLPAAACLKDSSDPVQSDVARA